MPTVELLAEIERLRDTLAQAERERGIWRARAEALASASRPLTGADIQAGQSFARAHGFEAPPVDLDGIARMHAGHYHGFRDGCDCHDVLPLLVRDLRATRAALAQAEQERAAALEEVRTLAGERKALTQQVARLTAVVEAADAYTRCVAMDTLPHAAATWDEGCEMLFDPLVAALSALARAEEA